MKFVQLLQAVAARFGIGKDFWINLLLTVLGYIPGTILILFILNWLSYPHIPGHGHNFYIQVTISYFSLIRFSFPNFAQNIRNNSSHARTPKWAQRYGLVDTSEIKRKQRKRQWATRYNDRLSQSAYEGQPYEEGQEQGSSVDIPLETSSNGKARREPDGDLWRPEDERFYNPDKSSAPTSSGRWHYPANFDEAEPVETGKRGKKKKEKKNRWERTQDAYSQTSEGNPGKKKKKKRKASEAASSVAVEDDVNEFPEDAEGGLYRERPQVPDKEEIKLTEEQVFNHQF